MDKPVVYFTKTITPETILALYKKLEADLPGKVAVKIHSGEEGNQNYLRPEYVAPLVAEVNGTIVECNTAYEGARNTTEKHERLMAEHGWSEHFDVDIMDADGNDLVLPIENGRILKKNYVGEHMTNYASMLVSPISRAIPWAATAERSSSFPLAAPPPPAK